MVCSGFVVRKSDFVWRDRGNWLEVYISTDLGRAVQLSFINSNHLFAWGVWHFSYFYIEGTLLQVQVIGFVAGLLINCFILSALYAKTHSLWICIMTHSMINVFSQIATGGNQCVLFICRIMIIMIAVVLSNQERRKGK